MLLATIGKRLLKQVGWLAAMGLVLTPAAWGQERYEYEELRHHDEERGTGEFEDETEIGDPEAFEQPLAEHGHWVETADYGRCWMPAGVAVGWRPYTVGHWAYTTCGWTWVTAEPWGWATYHYGRWVMTPTVGWVWVPGRVWAPAWVTWRFGEGYVGWAPLPPMRTRTTLTYHVDAIPTMAYTFVDERYIADRDVHYRAIPVERNITIINHTTNITKIEVENHRMVNRGVPVERIERATGHKVERVDVQEVRRPTDDRNRLITGHMVMDRQPTPAAVRRTPVAVRGNNTPARPVEPRKAAERENRTPVKKAAADQAPVRVAETRDRQVETRRANELQTRGATGTVAVHGQAAGRGK